MRCPRRKTRKRGFAIGFGAQTLVKDIIAGIFFLIDDAVRVGDYVECGTAKGMVEQISLRSLRLRHPRGKVHILPFGDISNVTNLSLDYTIMKLDFRVRYDADVEKIRKIIKKKVYQPIMVDQRFGKRVFRKERKNRKSCCSFGFCSRARGEIGGKFQKEIILS